MVTYSADPLQTMTIMLDSGESYKSHQKSPRQRRAWTWVASALIFWAVLGCQHHFKIRHQGLNEPSESRVGDIHWERCALFPLSDCGTITVPKDYFDPEAGTATIAFARYNATKLPKKGSVFINPGGPGGRGVLFSTLHAPIMATLIGSQWDLIGFDPRGIGETTPAVRCFPDPIAERIFLSNTVIEQGITVSSIANLSSENLREELVLQYGQFLAMKQAQAQLCEKNMGDELKYMGTATVVRDIDFMSKVFDGEDAPINYWGGSYGTILGTYLVNMLPDRVGYVLIDGVADAVQWSSEPSQYSPMNWLSSTEKTYEVFLKDCAQAGPRLCALAHSVGEPWQKIEQRLESFFDKLVRSPVPVPFGVRPGFLTSGAARAIMFIDLYFPTLWPQNAENFAQAMKGNATALFNIMVPDYRLDNGGISASRDLSRLAVRCLDAPPASSPKDYPTAEELADIGLKTLREQSIHFGLSTGISEPDGGCQYWPVQGPERFTGPWNATLRTPMLIISNTYDPITPISSGLKINSLMPNSSILVIQDGPGHCSLTFPSLCTIKLGRQYFAGEMPANGTVCQVDRSTFPDEKDQDLHLEALSTSDRELLEAAQEVGRWMMAERNIRNL
ncbi:Alpha/Beta hydrolase protein [Mycena floridula]|nr:Alpha/Beta hydrolase protein [Mycena floridula]